MTSKEAFRMVGQDNCSISRRRIVGLLAGGGVAAWASRGLTEAQTSPPGGETPRYGGVFTQDTFADPPHFDLHQSETINALLPLSPCYNRLVQPDPLDVNKIIPDLAERWEISRDGRLYAFYLRRDVKFHHGKPLLAEDVKASWDRIFDPPKGVFSVRRPIFEAISGIETAGPNTVRFALKRPSWSLLTNMAHGWNVIFPKDVLGTKGDMKRDVVGTGPFKFKQYVRGVSLEVEKNSEYHVKGRPYLDGVKTFFIPDTNTAVNAYIAGQLMLHEVTVESQADQARQALGARGVVVKTPQMSCLTLEMNAGRKPWSDPRVRQAASMAIDRKEAMQVMTDGAGEVGGVMLPTGRWALPLAELQKLPGYSSDKAAERTQAKKLLAEAGLVNGFKTTMTVRRGQQYETAAVLLKDHLGQVGIEAKIDVVETATYLDRMARREFEICGTSFSTAVDDPDAILGQNYLCNAGRNYGNMCVPELEKLHIQQSQIEDFNTRLPVVHQVQHVILKNVMKAVLGFRVTWFLYASNVKGYRPQYSRYLAETREQVWLARA
jgi:peptide/nickel transport system substrate-binding protein